jgi:hypothetical protein
MIDEPRALAAVRSISAATASCRPDRQTRAADEPSRDEPAPAEARRRERAGADDRRRERASADDRRRERASAEDPDGDRASTNDPDGDETSTDDPDGNRASTNDPDGDETSTNDPDGERASADDPDAPESGEVVLSPAAQRGVRSHAAQVAFEFFVGKGLTSAQAAAIVGNLMQESNLDPASTQRDGPGHGIAQWSAGARWNKLLRFAKARRASPRALTTQLQFLWHELTTVRAYGLGALRAARSVAAATRVFAKSFEVCGVCNDARRIALAQATLRAHGNRAARRRRA